MAYFDNRPYVFRLLLVTLSVYLLGLAADNFYRYASVPTDENWFRTTPTNVYIVKTFPARRVLGRDNAGPDSIKVGDILREVNDADFDNRSLSQILDAAPNNDELRLKILRPGLDRYFIYQIIKSALPDSFYRLLPPTAYVFEVFKDGASDRAGMRTGDVIFRINGHDLKSHVLAAGEADAILRRGQIGKTIDYEVIRNNRPLTLRVKLAKFGIAFPILVMCFCGLIYFGTGFFIAFQRPQIKAARLIGLALLLVGFFLTITMLQRNAQLDPLGPTRLITMTICFFIGLAMWFHGSYYFPKEQPEFFAKPWIQFAPYGMALLCMGFAIFAVRRFGDFAFLMAYGLAVLLTAGYSWVISLYYRQRRTAEAKRLSRIIKWTGFIAGGVAVLLQILFLDRNTLGYIGIPFVLIPLAYLYTIGRYRLLDMDLRVRQNVQYSIISLLGWISLLAIFIKVLLALPNFVDHTLPNFRFTSGSIEILDDPQSLEQREFLEKGILMFIAIVLSLGFWKLGRIGRRLLDKKYYRAQYDYRRAASALADVMANKLSMVDIARGMVQKLSQLMHLKRAGVLFFRNQKACCCREAHGFDGSNWEEFCLAIDQKLLEVLQQFHSEARFSVDYLPNGLKQALQQHGFCHVIPIRSKNNLLGALLIGEKRSETPFYQDDLEFLTAAAKQASVAIENSFLHEELSEQERLKHELEIARRIQMASLPQTTPKVDGLDIAGVSIPAMEVGGDYFDYLNGVPNEIRVIVGDVSGKGTSAALYMSKVQGIMRSLHGFGLSPKELFVRANQLLYQDLERKSFVTSLGADFDSTLRRLVFARAGHLPLFHYSAKTKRVEKVTPRGLGLGLDNHGAFATELEEKMIQYEAGDVFLFVTDGVTETQGNDGKEFGEESVSTILESSSAFGATKIRDRVINAVKQFAGNNAQHDDLTVVVVKAV